MTVCAGYDGSPSSAEAVRWAAAEADHRGEPLEIVSCFAAPALPGAGPGWPVAELLDAAHEDAAALAADAGADAACRHRELVVTTRVEMASAASELMRGRASADLVVVGASGHRGAAAFWLGSTPRQLVRHSPCPVVVVRGAASRGRPDRIVVGVDDSASSDRAIDWACAEADRHQVELLVVHGWLYPYLEATPGPTAPRQRMQIDAACTLERAVERARDRSGGDVQSALVEGQPADALLATTRDGDLLVLGSRGRRALTAGLLGSTVNDVLDRADVPVVVVRSA